MRTDGVRAAALVRARRPHDSPLADSTVGEHCDRYVVTVASPRTGIRKRRVRSRKPVADPFSQPVVSSRSLNRCAPCNWDPTIGTLGARPGFFANPHVTTADAAVPMAHLHSSNAPSGGAP